MNGLIRASLGNPYAVTVMSLTFIVLGVLSLTHDPDRHPAGLQEPGGADADLLRRHAGQQHRQRHHQPDGAVDRPGQRARRGRSRGRSSAPASSATTSRSDVDPNGALTQVNSLALAAIPNLPPGTLPPVVLPFDPTATTPVCVVAVDSADPANNESVLYDVGRYEVRNMIMGIPGAVAPVVFGGKIRAVMAYLDRQKMQARGLSPLDVMKALDDSNVFLPTGDAKFGDIDYALDSNSMFETIARTWATFRCGTRSGNAVYLRDVATPKDANYIQTNVVRVNGKREVYIPVFRQLGASTLRVVNTLRRLAQGLRGAADPRRGST